jgi:Flp pilus assembly protein TadG
LIFALAGAALLITATAAVELTRVNDVRSKLAAITDAAALAGKRAQGQALGVTDAQAKVIGQDAAVAYFNGNKSQLDGIATNLGVTAAWDTDNSIRVTGSAKASMVLGSIFSLGGQTALSYIPVTTVSVAASGSEAYLEIALVLDNTGSMFNTDGRPQTRFTLLREAAVDFVNTAFDAATDADKVRISVVPWATTVNIKSEKPLTWSRAPVADVAVPDRGTGTLPANPINRNSVIEENAGTLATMFAPVGWRGCIVGEGEDDDDDDHHGKNDDYKPSGKWHALQVPAYLYMDSWAPSQMVNTTCTSCPPPPPGPPVVSPPPPPGGMVGENRQNPSRLPRMATAQPKFTTPMRKLAPKGFTDNNISNVQLGCTTSACVQEQCIPGIARVTMPACGQDTKKYYGGDPYTSGRRNTYSNVTQTCLPWRGWCSAAPMQTNNLVACTADPNEIAWNKAGGAWCAWVPATTWTKFDPTTGPNINCPMPMLGLSPNRAQVLATINRMSPVPGGTHADVGLLWGARTLSPNKDWGKFFGIAGKEARNWKSKDVKKAVILITDGENSQAEDFPGYWNCSDTSAPGCSGAPNQAQLNTRMIDWCNKLNNDWKVDVYTVAVNVNNAAAVSLLAQCAGSPARAFSGDASELQNSLRQVASQLFELHLKE